MILFLALANGARAIRLQLFYSNEPHGEVPAPPLIFLFKERYWISSII